MLAKPTASTSTSGVSASSPTSSSDTVAPMIVPPSR